MTSSQTRPSRAAKTAALENALWLGDKAPSAKSGTQKRQRSPGTSASAGTKKTRYTQVVKNKPLLKTTSVHAATKKKPTPAPSRREPVCINLDSDQDYSGNDEYDDGGNNNKEQVARGSSTETDSEAESGEDLRGLDPNVIHATLEKENVEWGTNAGARDNQANLSAGSTGRHNADNGSDSDDNGDNVENPGLTKLYAKTKRVADRLAEAPQWTNTGETDSSDNSSDLDADPMNAESGDGDQSDTMPDTGSDVGDTSQGTGTPFSSEEEQNEDVGHLVLSGNRGWGPECHYVPPSKSSSLIRLTIQPANLRSIIRIAIKRVMADVLHEFAFCPIDKLIGYNRSVLYKTAKSLNLIPYAKRFYRDSVFARNIGRVLNGRVSSYRGQVKWHAANKVEGYYGLLEGDGRIEKIKSLLHKSTFIYPTSNISGHENPEVVLSKPYFHPAIIAVLRETYFTGIRGASLGTKYHRFFKSSIPEHATELELPVAMLALVATTIHLSLDDYATGVCRRGEFNADLYEDVYICHVTFLRHIQEGSATKYHRLMADLYTQSTSVCIMLRTVTVINEAIAQLDLDEMDE